MQWNWTQLAKFVAGALAAVAAIAAIYTALLSRPASLTAEVSFDRLALPDQFVTRQAATNEQFQYKTLYDQIRMWGGDSLTHEKIHALATYLVNMHFAPYTGLFEKGPLQYPDRIFIRVVNNSNKVAKDVIVTFPAAGLAAVEDEAGAYSVTDKLVPSIKIPSISPSNHARVWVYLPEGKGPEVYGGLRIVHADGVADVYVNSQFNGINAWMAEHTETVLMVAAVMLLLIVGLLILL